MLPEVAKLVRQDARRFHVGESFVLATIVTQHYERVLRRQFFGQERYETVERPSRLRRVV